MPQKLLVAIKPTYRAPVVFLVAGDDAVAAEIRFSAVFRRLTQTQAKDMQQRLDARTLTDPEVLQAVLVGWDGLSAEDGTPFAFTPENLVAAEEDWPGFIAAIVLSWFAHNAPAAAKN